MNKISLYRVTTLLAGMAAVMITTTALAAENYFHLKVVDGRDWLIAPSGKPFFPHGVNHIERHGKGDAVKAVSAACKEMGFNAYGYGCPEGLHDDMPYLESWNDLVPISIHRDASTFKYLDIFDTQVQQRIEQQIAETCSKNKNNPNLIGYLWTDLAGWPLDGARRHPWSPVSRINWVQFCRTLPASAAGKRAYVGFLRSEYKGDFAACNTVYRTAATDWDSLAKEILPAEAVGEKQLSDDQKFLRLIARQYFKVLGEATRKNDPNHLIFGDRFIFSTIVPEVIEEELPYVDAIAIQPNYAPRFPRADYERVHALTKKPIVLCDFAIRFKDGDKRINGGKLEKDAAAAGNAYVDYIREARQTPYIIGAFWCGLVDSPQNNGIKQGFFLPDLQPRPGLFEPVKALNRELQP